jgi:hypothetical protein
VQRLGWRTGHLNRPRNARPNPRAFCFSDLSTLNLQLSTVAQPHAFRADPNYHVENFKIINANTNEEYR